MTLYESQLSDIVRSHTQKEKRILTWRGWRKVKILNKTAALYDICAAFAREFEQQEQSLNLELARMRAEIEAAQKNRNSNEDLRKAAPGYVFEELRVLFKKLDQELSQANSNLPDGTRQVLKQIQNILIQNQEEQLRIVDDTEKDSQEQMENLRRRLVRMAKDLNFSEAEVARLRRELNAAYDSGVASVYKSVQGVSNTDRNATSKRNLLSKLFESNVELRKKLNG